MTDYRKLYIQLLANSLYDALDHLYGDTDHWDWADIAGLYRRKLEDEGQQPEVMIKALDEGDEVVIEGEAPKRRLELAVVNHSDGTDVFWGWTMDELKDQLDEWVQERWEDSMVEPMPEERDKRIDAYFEEMSTRPLEGAAVDYFTLFV